MTRYRMRPPILMNGGAEGDRRLFRSQCGEMPRYSAACTSSMTAGVMVGSFMVFLFCRVRLLVVVLNW